MRFLDCSGGKTNNSQMSYFYFCDFNKVLGLNSFWLHSSNCLCLFSIHETNHTITLEAESLELHCLGYFEFPLFKCFHAHWPLESLRTEQVHFIKACTQINESDDKVNVLLRVSQHVCWSSSGWEATLENSTMTWQRAQVDVTCQYKRNAFQVAQIVVDTLHILLVQTHYN